MSTTATPKASPVDIETLLAEFDTSRQSAAEFARSRGIAVWKLRYALSRRSGKSRARRAKPAQRATFVPVQLVAAARTAAPPALELLLAGGQRLQIREGFDPALLRRVVEALSGC